MNRKRNNIIIQKLEFAKIENNFSLHLKDVYEWKDDSVLMKNRIKHADFFPSTGFYERVRKGEVNLRIRNITKVRKLTL